MRDIITSRLRDNIFIGSSLIFNIFVSGVYIATKLENKILLQVCGAFVIFLIFPYTLTLLGYIGEKADKKILLSNIVILFYLFLELSLDYLLRVPFREILALHIPYIIVFYAAEFSIIGVSFNRNRNMGFAVTFTFFILLTCLAYLYLG